MAAEGVAETIASQAIRWVAGSYDIRHQHYEMFDDDEASTEVCYGERVTLWAEQMFVYSYVYVGMCGVYA